MAITLLRTSLLRVPIAFVRGFALRDSGRVFGADKVFGVGGVGETLYVVVVVVTGVSAPGPAVCVNAEITFLMMVVTVIVAKNNVVVAFVVVAFVVIIVFVVVNSVVIEIRIRLSRDHQ